MAATFDNKINSIKYKVDEVYEGKRTSRTYTLSQINPEATTDIIYGLAEACAACQTGTSEGYVIRVVTEDVAQAD